MKQQLFFIILLLLALTVHAEEYYADLSIVVSQNGEVNLSGTTNHPDLQAKTTQEFTSKQGEKWTLAISTSETFSEYVYSIKFPQGTQILDMNIPNNYRISMENNELVITGTGENAPLIININYSINSNKTTGIDPIFFFIFGIVLAFGGYFYYKKLNQNKTVEKKATLTFNKDALSERQLQIVEYLEKHNGKATQSELAKVTNLPKASLSRNLDSLEKKEIIQRERKGMTMLISFKEKKV